MTEQEWFASEDPAMILEYVGGKWSDRKLRLFACSCVRQSWRLLDTSSRVVIETAESFADGGASKEETFRLASSCMTIARCLMPTWNSSEEANAVIGTAEMHNSAILPTYADLLRDIVGNLWRQDHVHVPYHKRSQWLTPTVLSLAQAAYDERNNEGTIDPGRLAVLSDALEEAGCDNDDILFHFRGVVGCDRCEGAMAVYDPLYSLNRQPCPKCGGEGLLKPSPHVRGCWALDLILGKE